MRTRLFIFVAILVALPGLAVAQLPFTIDWPENDTLEFQTSVGVPVTKHARLIRLDKSTETLAILDLERPFSSSANPVTFQTADTLSVAFDFTPEEAGPFEVTIQFSNGSYSIPLMLRGMAVDTVRQFSVSPDSIDLGVIPYGESRSGSFTISAIGNVETGLSWTNTPIQTTVNDTIAYGDYITRWSSSTVEFTVDSKQYPPGVTTLVIEIINALPGLQPIGYKQTEYVVITFVVDDGRPRLSVDPSRVEFSRFDDEPYESQIFMVTNLSDLDVVVDSIRFEPNDAIRAIFSTSAPTFPVLIGGGSTVTFKVECDHAATGINSGWIDIWGRWFAESDAYVIASLDVVSTDTIREQAPPIMMTMTTNDAKVGELCRATFMNVSDLPADLDHGIVTLRYNATVLIPKTETLDDEDPITDGRRTSRFKLTPASHSGGDQAGVIDFIVALGNASNTSLDVVEIDWRTADSASLGLPTEINGTVVSVIDGDGFEVNVDPGPLSISVAPIPAAAQATIRYRRDVSVPTTLRMYDRTGALVHDLSGQLTAATGEISLGVSDLSAGSYFLHLHGGPYTYVTMVLIE